MYCGLSARWRARRTVISLHACVRPKVADDLLGLGYRVNIYSKSCKLCCLGPLSQQISHRVFTLETAIGRVIRAVRPSQSFRKRLSESTKRLTIALFLQSPPDCWFTPVYADFAAFPPQQKFTKWVSGYWLSTSSGLRTALARLQVPVEMAVL